MAGIGRNRLKIIDWMAMAGADLALILINNCLFPPPIVLMAVFQPLTEVLGKFNQLQKRTFKEK